MRIGETFLGKPFTLPDDAVAQTFSILAIRGAGKTSTACVMAEEMCKAGLPWICFDPVGVWWGMRSTTDGHPSGFPIVVLGGTHGDIPIQRDQGAKIAEALVSEHVYAVIDLSQESKKFWHVFLTDFCLKLMDLSPPVPRHLFIEEAPEFVPQRTRVELTARCKEAVERVIRLGRNRGYGCTLISQRPATVDKDVLSQTENLFVLRTVGPHDRKALQDWIEAQASDKKLEQFMGEIASLPNGTAFFWSPHWLDTFEKVKIRQRLTFHPGETRQIGKIQKSVAMTDVREFVESLRSRLESVKGRAPKAESHPPKPKESPLPISSDASLALDNEIQRLREELSKERALRTQAEKRVAAVRQMLQPQYDSLQALFDAVGNSGGGTVNRADYEPWLRKAGKAGTRRLLEMMLDRQALTRTQLATLAGLGPNTGTFRNYLSWLKRNGIVEIKGEIVELRPL